MSELMPSPDQDPAAPPRLVQALQSLHGPRPAVPPAVDQAILARARAQLRPSPAEPRPRPLRLPFAFAPQALAVAAALVLGLGLMFLLRQTGPQPAPALAREDIDRNGRVDILDAFALARRLQGASAGAGAVDVPAVHGDVNGDGVFDQRDIDRVAARAVALQPTKG